MITRALDSDGDWTFGKGRSDYLNGNLAIAQNLATRLRCFLGDCFFDIAAGVDWFNLLGGKDLIALNLAVKTCIINTSQVIGIVEVSIRVSSGRHASLIYSVKTVLPGVLRGSIGLILDENGDFLTTESGDHIHA